MSKQQRIAIFIGAICTVILIVTQLPKQAPKTEPALDHGKLLQELGTLVVLPKDEQPVIAEVSDSSALASMPFFQQANVGDIVFIYHRAKKAILYDPVKKKIVAIAPIENGNQP